MTVIGAIDVKFGALTLPRVTSIAPASSLSVDAIVDAATLEGLRVRRLAVSGHVKRKGTKLELLTDQKDFEESLAAVGPSTLSYPGMTPFLARLVSIEWQEYAGGPIVVYTATFEAEIASPFAEGATIEHAPSSDSKTFAPAPSVADSFRSVDAVDELPSGTADKSVTIQGVLRGTAVEVKAEIAAIKALLVKSAPFALTIASGVYSARVESFDFTTPSGTDVEATSEYQIQMVTLPDFTLEGRSLLGGPLTLGPVSFDVATSFSHGVERDSAGLISSESISGGGKKFFETIGAADAYKSTVNGFVTAKTTLVSGTGKTLVLKSVNWSEPKRDGHTTAGEKRYSLSFSTSWSLDPGATSSLSGVVLGVTFTVLTSFNRSVSFAEDGTVTSESRSGSGKISGTPGVTPGGSVSEDGKTFFITSLNLGTKDGTGLRQASVNGKTLDTAAATEELFPLFFEGFFLDHVDSTNRSVSYSFDPCDDRFKAQSVSASVSGFKIGDDGGVLDLISTINRSVGSFIVTSVSRGAPEKKRVGGTVQKRFPISISGVLNLVGRQENACEEPPDIKVEEERSVTDATTKYTQINIPGKGIVFKKVGLNPAEETVTVSHVARTEGIFATMAFPADPTSSIAGEKIGRKTSKRGLTKGVTVRFRRFTEGAVA